MRLNLTQRNAFFEAILNAGLDPRDFTITNLARDGEDEAIGEGLSHPATGSLFAVDRERHVGGDFVIYVRIGGGDTSVARRISWDGIPKDVTEWAQAVVREASTVDLWATLADERRLASHAAGPMGVEPFNDDERQKVLEQVAEVRRYLTTIAQLNEGRLKQVHDQLTYLEDAAGRLSRKDWRMIALGTMVSLGAGAVLTPEQVREVLAILLQPLADLFERGMPQLPMA